jgi:predicted DNA-binding protein (UPF0251 family)
LCPIRAWSVFSILRGGKNIAVNKWGDHRNWDLLNRADYNDFNRVKEMMCLYTALEKWAHWESCGDRISASIFTDIRDAIYMEGVLTVKQREVVELICYFHFTQDMVAEFLKIRRQSVGNRFDGAVVNIQKALLQGKIFNGNTCKIGDIPYCNYRRDKYGDGRVDRWMKQRDGCERMTQTLKNTP